MWYAVKRNTNSSAPCWIAVTRLTRDKMGPLLEWSEPLFKGQNRQLHLIGPMQEQLELPDWVHYHGPATPAQLAQEWFTRAHGLVTLSEHAEGRPQVMLEAMAAGMPIIASPTCPLTPVSAGWCDRQAVQESPADYSAALLQLEDASCNTKYGAAARTWARGEIGTRDDCAQRYFQLYCKLIASGKCLSVCWLLAPVVLLVAHSAVHCSRPDMRCEPASRAQHIPLPIGVETCLADCKDPTRVVPTLKGLPLNSLPCCHQHTRLQCRAGTGRAGWQSAPAAGASEALQSHAELPLLYFSSAGALYGDNKLAPHKESDLATPKSYHGASKVAAEYYIRAWACQYGGGHSTSTLQCLRPLATTTRGLWYSSQCLWSDAPR